MKIEQRKVDNVVILDMSGKITIGDADILVRDTIDRLLDEGEKNILLNLEKVSYIDSAGIGELVTAIKKVKEEHGSIKLTNPSPKARRCLESTYLDRIFEIYGDEREALVSF